MFRTIIMLTLAVSLLACVPNQRPLNRPYVGTQNTGYQKQVPAYPLKSRQEMTELQQLLSDQGYRPGIVDGRMGKNTTEAIRRFQRSRGLVVDGLATSTVLQQLKSGDTYPAASSSSTAQKLRHEAKFFSQSTAVAAGVGAAIGGTIGGIVDGKKGAAIGIIAGGILAAGADYGLNTGRVDAANTEVDLNQTLNQIRQDNNRLSGLISTAKQLIDEDKNTIDQIKQQLNQKTISKQQAAKQYARLDENRKLLTNTYNDLKNKQQEWEQIAANNGHSPDINQEVEKLRGQIASLEEELGELDQLRSISQVG